MCANIHTNSRNILTNISIKNDGFKNAKCKRRYLQIESYNQKFMNTSYSLHDILPVYKNNWMCRLIPRCAGPLTHDFYYYMFNN